MSVFQRNGGACKIMLCEYHIYMHFTFKYMSWIDPIRWFHKCEISVFYFKSNMENDLLTAAIGTPEHPRWVPRVSSTLLGWGLAFPNDHIVLDILSYTWVKNMVLFWKKNIKTNSKTTKTKFYSSMSF